jgi:hypothetical protein
VTAAQQPEATLYLALLIGIAILFPASAHAQQAAKITPAGQVSSSIEQMEAQAVEWLARQMVPNETVPAPAPTRRRLLLSYRVSTGDPAYRYIYGRSFIYDDALGAVAFTMVNRYHETEQLLNSIVHLVGADGSLWFAYNTQNNWPSESDHEGALVRTGALAWVGYALTYYLQARQLDSAGFAYQDRLGVQFRENAEAIARYILARQVSASDDPRFGLVTGGTGSSAVSLSGAAATPTESYNDAAVQWVSMEHNIDTWYFLRDLGRLTSDGRYSEAAERIRLRLLDLWSDEDGQFIQGIHADRAPDTVLPLDGASWGAIFLLSQGRDAQAGRCLDGMEKRFGVQLADVRGYRPYGREPVYTDERVNAFYYPPSGRLWSDLPLVWGEGSLGAAAAYIRAGRPDEGRKVMESMRALAVEGGFRYTTTPVPHQFSDYPSVATTAWFVIATEMLRGTPVGDLLWGK